MLIANLIYALPSLAGVVPIDNDVGKTSDAKPQKLHAGNKHDKTDENEPSEGTDKKDAEEGQAENDDGSSEDDKKNSAKSNSTSLESSDAKNSTFKIQGEVANDISSSKSLKNPSTNSLSGVELPPSTVNSDPSQLSSTPPASTSPFPLTSAKSLSGASSDIPIGPTTTFGSSKSMPNPFQASPSQGMESSPINVQSVPQAGSQVPSSVLQTGSQSQFPSQPPTQKSISAGFENSPSTPPQSGTLPSHQQGQGLPNGPGLKSPEMGMGPPGHTAATGTIPGGPPKSDHTGAGFSRMSQGHLTTQADLTKIRKTGNCQTIKTATGFIVKCVTIGGQRQPHNGPVTPPTGMPQNNIPQTANNIKQTQPQGQQSVGQGAESSPSPNVSQQSGTHPKLPMQSQATAPKISTFNPSPQSADDQLFASISRGLNAPSSQKQQ